MRVAFVKEALTFSGDDSPMAHLMLSVMGAFAEFERALLKERQHEGIALAEKRGGLSRTQTNAIARANWPGENACRRWQEKGNPLGLP